jgi:Ala-tRNA(Pro) deacylase
LELIGEVRKAESPDSRRESPLVESAARRVDDPPIATISPVMSESAFQRVESLLKRHGVAFDVLRHEPVYTSQEAAAVRGTPLCSGAKALICKGDDQFVMFVMPADRKLASRAIRRGRGWRRLRFASPEEVQQLTGLAPGSIPPFGSLFNLPTLCDAQLGENETINFNAGDHRISVSMRYADYFKVEAPELGAFAE